MQPENPTAGSCSTDIGRSNGESSSDFFPDALLDAGAVVLAQLRREWTRDLELMKAQSGEIIAALRAENIELRHALYTEVGRRLTELKDGEQGEPGRNGRDGEQGARGAQGERGPAGERGEPGEPGRNGEAGAPGARGAPGPAGEQGPAGERGEPGRNGRDGAAGTIGPQGERGEPGPRGMLDQVTPWTDRIFYRGALVEHHGATWQACQDTAKEPCHCADWQLVAAAGTPGGSFKIRGTHRASERYQQLDVVTLDYGWFVAKHDDPGPIPGPGWQAGPVGRRGEKGIPGERGARGEPGKSAPHWIGVKVAEDYELTAVMSDGSIGPRISLAPMFEQFRAELQSK